MGNGCVAGGFAANSTFALIETGPWLKRGGSQGSPFFIHRYDSNAGLIRAVTSDNLFRIGLRWTRHAGNASNASFNGGLRPGG